jgi:hypothetical protein
MKSIGDGQVLTKAAQSFFERMPRVYRAAMTECNALFKFVGLAAVLASGCSSDPRSSGPTAQQASPGVGGSPTGAASMPGVLAAAGVPPSGTSASAGSSAGGASAVGASGSASGPGAAGVPQNVGGDAAAGTGDTADLAPPPADKGVQFAMPVHAMQPGTEWEGCFASYYDFSDRVPAKYKTSDGNEFYVNSTVIHQTQGSHHLVIMNTHLAATDTSDPSLGAWTCKGGMTDAAACDPHDATACRGGGVCGSTPKEMVACIGYGPPAANVNAAGFGLGTAQQSQLTVPPIDGVYRSVPIKGVIFWDLHAFNLTTEPHVQRAFLNLTYADDRRFLEQRLTVTGNLDGVAPYTQRDLCAQWVVPKGLKIIRMTSHSHKRGMDFRAKDPSGKLLYESTLYSDPAYITFDPPLAYDSDDATARTMTFCNVYNNGLNADGTANYDLVTKLSETPSYDVQPSPVACTKGRVAASCISLLGDSQCDSIPGAGDGKCDAASIHFGVSTQSEMFFLLPDVINPEGADAIGTDFGSTYVFATPLPPSPVKN